MRHMLSREDYEDLFGPESYPKSTTAAASELVTRGIQAKAQALDYLVAQGVVDVPQTEGGRRQWDRHHIDKAAEHLYRNEVFTPSTWSHLIEDSNPAQDIRARREAFAQAPHLPPDTAYFVRTVMPGAAGLGLYATIHYRPMTDEEYASWRARIEQAKKDREVRA